MDNNYTIYPICQTNQISKSTGITIEHNYDGSTVTDTEDSTFDDENRLLSTEEETYDYDSNGNLIEGDTDYRYLSTFLNGEKVNMLPSEIHP